VDDFTLAVAHIIAAIDTKMSITVKHLGFVTCFNGINITQTKHTSNFMQPLI